MSGVIDPLTFPTMNLPAVWAPATREELGPHYAEYAEQQVRGSLLMAADTVEAALRLLLNETETELATDPPEGYDPDRQGRWNSSRPAFVFRRPAVMMNEERDRDCLRMEIRLSGSGTFHVEITEERITMERTDG